MTLYNDDKNDDNNNDDSNNNNNHDNDNSNDNKNYFSLIPQQFELTVFSKLVSWLSKLLLKAGDIAENPGPVIRSQNTKNILSFRIAMALLFVYSVELGENEGKCCVLNILNNSFKDKSSYRMNKYIHRYQNFKLKIGIDNFISSKFILSMIIYLLLLQYGISPNPGPENTKKSNLSLVTYNCRGLMDVRKLRRVLAKVGPLVDKNCIVALQETHKIDDRLLKLYWKHNFIRNCNHSNKKGVVLLFNNEFRVNKFDTDKDDRYITVGLENSFLNLIVGNVYFPNDHLEAVSFTDNFYTKLIEFQYLFPEAYTVILGDFNMCMEKNDSVNRIGTQQELDLVKKVKANNKSCDLVDTYRMLKCEEGYTWSRGNLFSRLDYIFASSNMTNKLVQTKVDWCFDRSDHAALFNYFLFDSEPARGPGITKLNVKLLDDNNYSEQIRQNLVELLDQIPKAWNPHTKLEFTKVAIRTAFSSVANIANKVKRQELEEIDEKINRMQELKAKELNCSIVNSVLVNKINMSLEELTAESFKLREKYSDDLAFKSQVKWYEEGEKSNKYFLGLMKMRSKQKAISKINDNGVEFLGQSNVMKCIKNFYSLLYRKGNIFSNNETDNNFFQHCPKLNEKSKLHLEKDILLDELAKALSSCKESAPGPDGITYKVYKKFWSILSIYIIESWIFSVETGILPPSHLESALSLLPKEGKNLNEIKNWRPITLSNCDSKIITKALANRMANHLNEIIDPSQTAYVPGRSVMDNIRSNFYIKNLCKSKKIDGLLISLDAKKAFDSVSHDYIRETLRAYGFGDKFIKYFNTLYNGLSVKVLVNGFLSEKINIERGVKQGDALSCSLFILCMDPLIRNLNENKKIEPITFKSKWSVSMLLVVYF